MISDSKGQKQKLQIRGSERSCIDKLIDSLFTYFITFLSY